MKKINWGIIGCGAIARKFATSLKSVPEANLLACASRTPGKAEALGTEFEIPQTYSTYEELLANPEVHLIYVATSHNFHFENTKLCLEHGKHVLCEKAFTINARQAKELIALARAKNLFLMEGMWTRFLPLTVKLRELLEQKIIGELLTFRGNFCIKMPEAMDTRLRQKALAGGALLDLGVYPISYASMLFGEQPQRIQSSAVLGPTGVDERSFYLFEYGDGRTAQMESSFTYSTPPEIFICGTEGYIQIPEFYRACELTVCRHGEDPLHIERPIDWPTSFRFEIMHAMECVASGKTESPIMPLNETIEIMTTMDALRAQWGLSYPDE